MDEIFLGFGLGLRAPHYSTVLENLPKVDWFEVVETRGFVEHNQAKYYQVTLKIGCGE